MTHGPLFLQVKNALLVLGLLTREKGLGEWEGKVHMWQTKAQK